MIIIDVHGSEDLERQLAALGAALPRVLRRGLSRAGERGVALLAGVTPRSTQSHAHLADSFASQLGGMGDEVFADITTSMPDRARFVRGGTAPHPITARRARALRFVWSAGPRGPGVYFFRRVSHPGTAANDFVARAIEQIRQAAYAELAVALHQEGVGDGQG